MASLPPLAQPSDVIVRLPAAMNVEIARTTALLLDASAVVRSFTRQMFTITQTTEKIRPIGIRVKLPQHPVVSVDALALQLPGSTTPTPFSGWYWDGSDEVSFFGQGQIINLAEELEGVLRWQTPIVFVTYTHGYTQTPDDVVSVVCNMVIRALTAPNLGGVMSEAAGTFTYKVTDTAAQGVVGLTSAERKVLNSYRPRKSATAELRGG